MMNRSSAAIAIITPAGCRPAKAAAFFAAVWDAPAAALAVAAPPFLYGLCILAFDFLFLHEAGKGIACKLRVLLQGFVILEVHVCLKCCLFCLCRVPVGFQFMAAVACFNFLVPYLAPRSASSSDLCAPSTPELSFSTLWILL